MNFTASRYAILFLNSEIYIMYVINHEWNRSMFVASAVCFVWDTKPDFPTISIRARFSDHVWITCDWGLEFNKTVIFVFSNFCIKLLFHKPCVHWSIYAIYCFAWFQEDTAVTFVLCRMFFGVCIHQGHHLHILRMDLLLLCTAWILLAVVSSYWINLK